MASIHESSKSTEQEEQDYLYGVVPKEWCETHSVNGPEELGKNQWLTYVSSDTRYRVVLFQVTNRSNKNIRFKGWWQHHSLGNKLKFVDEEESVEILHSSSFRAGSSGFWVKITPEMAAKMRILHGF